MRSIIYLHGFHSSPFSAKALSFNRYLTEHYPDIQVLMPQLAAVPNAAIKQVTELYHQHQHDLLGVVGSSLGGYLATYLHNQFTVPAVVINPAVKPFDLFAEYLGPQVHPITQEAYELLDIHIEQLRAIYQPSLKDPTQVWCLQQKGDEVLDYRLAEAHYCKAKLTLEPGGDHSFVGFERYLAKIVDFLL